MYCSCIAAIVAAEVVYSCLYECAMLTLSGNDKGNMRFNSNHTVIIIIIVTSFVINADKH